MRGTLFLIVGPSGAGKDTLIAAARAKLGSEFVFPHRVITRPVDVGAEGHIAETVAGFEAHERAGAFALSWRAHGLCYGVPVSAAAELAHGRHVVANVSRAVVAEARAKFMPTKTILVTASEAVLKARLAARGRESAPDAAARMDRAVDVTADSVIVNDGALEDAVAAFVAALKG